MTPRPSLFVLGSPRSGTTVFRLLLSSHPEICIPPECGFALWLAGRYAAAPFPEASDAFVADVARTKKFETWELSHEALAAEFARHPPGSYPEAAGCVYRAYARKRGRPEAILGDKNNFYVDHVDTLHAVFPDACLQWITRDPRDVFCSWRDLGARRIDQAYAPRLATDPDEFCSVWLKAHEALKAARDHFGRRLLHVRYEDLATRPEEVLTLCCEHLGLRFHPAMLDFHSRSDEPADFMAWKEKTTSPINASMVGRHRTDLPAPDRIRIEQRLGPAMKALGHL